MSQASLLRDFVRDALSAGRSREEIASALTQAKWSEKEIETALDAFDPQPFVPPVPRPTPYFSARDAFLYLVQFTSLAFASTSCVFLLHIAIEYAFDPEVTRSGWRFARYNISVLVVSVPILWASYRYTARLTESGDPGRSVVRKWLTYAAVFVSGFISAATLVGVIYDLLDGGSTAQFLLKALVIELVSGWIFVVFLRDLERRD
ncbi:MAG: DUF5671 domain-containing protein [Pseudomonadota bacterium]